MSQYSETLNGYPTADILLSSVEQIWNHLELQKERKREDGQQITTNGLVVILHKRLFPYLNVNGQTKRALY